MIPFGSFQGVISFNRLVPSNIFAFRLSQEATFFTKEKGAAVIPDIKGDNIFLNGIKENKDKSCKESKVIDIRNYKPKRIPQLMWRECIKKIQ